MHSTNETTYRPIKGRKSLQRQQIPKIFSDPVTCMCVLVDLLIRCTYEPRHTKPTK